MLTFNDTGKQISPCIAAKARYALDNQRNQPANQKRCSQIYWNKVIDTLCENNPILNINIENAKEMYNQYFNIL
jgi:hypothetical protein